MKNQDLDVTWQQKGHDTKKEILKQLTTFAVTTIGFATSVLLFNNEKVPILRTELTRSCYFLGIVLAFISLSFFLVTFFVLMRVEFEYSKALGTRANKPDWKYVDRWHLAFYWILVIAIVIYVSSLVSFFWSILNAIKHIHP